MKTISIRELHEKTGEWVRAAAAHEQIIVTDSGKPVAVLISHGEYERLRSKRLSPAAALRAWRESAPTAYDGFELPDREPSPGRDVRF